MQGIACSLGTLLKVARGEEAATRATATARVHAALQRYGGAFEAWRRARLELAAADASAAAAAATQRVWRAPDGHTHAPRDIKLAMVNGALQVRADISCWSISVADRRLQAR